MSLANLSQNSFFAGNSKKNSNLLLIFMIAIILYTVNLFTAIYNDFDLLVIFRQLLPILLFALGFVIVFDVSELLTPKNISIQIILVGLFSALNTFIRWSQLHGATKFSIDRLGLDTDLLGLLALILIVSPVQWVRWKPGFRLLIGSTIVGLFLGTFSRSFIPSFAMIAIFVLLNNRRNMVERFLKTIIFLSIGSVLVLLGLKFSGLLTSSTFLRRYTQSFFSLSKGGLSDSGLGSDPSLLQRKAQGQYAWEIWQDHKIFGTGILDPAITMDNFMGSIATNGIFGATLLISIFAGAVFFISKYSPSVSLANFLAKGFFLLLIVYSLIGNWPTNKSAWLAMLFILLLHFSESRVADNESKGQSDGF